jgi:hypothetical protein
MRLTAPLYEGDSLIRSGPAYGESTPGVPTKPGEAKPETAIELDVAEIEARARTLRAAYVGAWLGRLWERFEAWLEKGRRDREEAYLAQAENLADLEARMRKLERDGYIARI